MTFFILCNENRSKIVDENQISRIIIYWNGEVVVIHFLMNTEIFQVIIVSDHQIKFLVNISEKNVIRIQ